MLCNGCDAVYINGIKCHEIGCPEQWKEYKSECEFCGCEFIPEVEGQRVCGEECAEAYYN